MLFKLFTLVVVSLLGAQEKKPSRKPVLIRPDKTEAKDETATVLLDVQLARKHLGIGDFYFKRGNYEAAKQRYADAIRYSPKWAKSYAKLVRTLERLDAIPAAAKICDQFVKANPSSGDSKQFRNWAERLRASFEK